MQGKGQEALKLFEKIQKYKIIYLWLLYYLLADTVLVKQGQALFDKMIKDYKIKPKMEHYACMVDLLGRAGWLKEADKNHNWNVF